MDAAVGLDGGPGDGGPHDGGGSDDGGLTTDSGGPKDSGALAGDAAQDAGLLPTSCDFALDQVYVVGRIDTTATAPFAVTRVSNPDGLLCLGLGDFTAGYIRASDRKLVYLDTQGVVRVMVPDELTWNDTSKKYELLSPEANDEVLGTLSCPDDGWILSASLLGAPDNDNFIYRCERKGWDYYFHAYWNSGDEASAKLDQINWLGASGLMTGIRWSYYEVDGGPVGSPVGFDALFKADAEPIRLNADGSAFRAHGDGFWYAGGSDQLLIVSSTGDITMGDTYAHAQSAPAALDGQANGYGGGTDSDGKRVIIRIPFVPDSSTIVYRPHPNGSDLGVHPPRVTVFLDHATLISAP